MSGAPVVLLGDVTTKVVSGATPRGGEAAYKSSGIPLVRSMNVHFDGFRRDGLAFLDEEQARALKNVEVRAGDVLLNITGASIGRVTVAPPAMDGARVNQHVCIIRPDQRLDSSFLRWYLASPLQQRLINGIESGATRQALTRRRSWIRGAALTALATARDRRGDRKAVLPPRRSRRQPQARQGQPQALQGRRPQSRRRRPASAHRSRTRPPRRPQLRNRRATPATRPRSPPQPMDWKGQVQGANRFLS